MSGTFNLSFVLWIFLLALKIQSASGFFHLLKVPALGRTCYGIGSLYDGRTGNFLPPEFSLISEKNRSPLNPKFISRKPTYGSKSYQTQILRFSHKVRIGPKFDQYYSYGNKNGLALRAVLGMLEFPENGTAGFLLDKITQEEIMDISSKHFIFSSHTEKLQDELILPGTKQNSENSEYDWIFPRKKLIVSPQDFDEDAKELQREIRQNLKEMNMKTLEKATHVVVKVIRGPNLVVDLKLKNSTETSFSFFGILRSFNLLNSKIVTSVRVFSDGPASPFNSSSSSGFNSASMFDNYSMKAQLSSQLGYSELSPSTPEGVPLSFELMPLLPFLDEFELKVTPFAQKKFKALENSRWRDPMQIDHSATFENLDWTWLLTRQILKLNSTFHQCLQENPGKDVKKAAEMIQELQNVYENFTETFSMYKRDLKSLLEKSSSGTSEDEKYWDSIYLKEWEAVGTGVHWDFYRNLERAQQKVFDLGAEHVPEISLYFYNNVNGTKRGCDAIPEIL